MFQKHEKSDKVKNEVFLEDVEVSKYRFLWLQILISVYLICNYRLHLVLKMQVPDHYFLKNLDIPHWNLHFPPTGKYYAAFPRKYFQVYSIEYVSWVHIWYQYQSSWFPVFISNQFYYTIHQPFTLTK